ncbi:uncharacterized protein B0H64DRAFT_471641 [Chaetomium fimeti]|uniref:Altered inheritance of mitochondria protein 11 n=1 Tax=Chaetomium fimeti TaxID=1854472 RepID=A0AAE0HKR5_9PEZI|nr:hypothetical protein B0H64DRAFT_471641 [Chaetomium fimeti]
MGVLSYLIGSLTGVTPASQGDNKTPPTAPTSASTISTPYSPPASTPAQPTAPPHQGQPSSPLPPPGQNPQQIDYYAHYFSARSLKQLTLFLGGAGCFYLSVMVSRRAAIRHQLAARLKFYQPNQFVWRSEKDLPNKKDPMVAFEALNLATLNTMAFAITAAGGASWALDIADMEDLRRYARRSIVEAGGERDEAAEREVAEWMVSTFGLGGEKALEGLEAEKKGLEGGGEEVSGGEERVMDGRWG